MSKTRLTVFWRRKIPATSPISQRGAVAIAVWTFSSLSRFVTRDLDESNRDLGPDTCSIYSFCCL